ncbi:MAG: hypothetical protein ACTTJO_02855 [Metamycoplasmataceae bacterium]
MNLDFDAAFNEYLTFGGIPFLINQKTDEEKTKYLINLYNEIYLKDIKERYKIKMMKN